MTASAETTQTAKPKVLALADHLGHENGKVHGGTTYFVNHYPAMKKRMQLSVCFLAVHHPASLKLESSGIAPIFLGRSKMDPRAISDVYALAGQDNPDIIHAHSEKSIMIAGLIGLAKGIPWIVHIHDAIPIRFPFKTLQRWLGKRAAACIVITEELRDHAIKEFGFPPENIHVINYGLNLDPFTNAIPGVREKIRDELKIDQTIPLIGLVGRVNPDKGQLQMIEAMSIIKKSIPKACLLIVGDGPSLHECIAKTKKLELSGSIVFTGQRSDIPEILQSVDLVTVPSIWKEGFGFVALEAISAGKPVVASNSGGLPNTVVDGVTGTLVPSGDIEKLAEAILDLLSNPEKMKEFSKAGRAHASSFTMKPHMEKLQSLYQKILLKQEYTKLKK